MCGGGGGGGDTAARNAANEEQFRKDQIRGGIDRVNERFAGFNDDFYNQRAQQFSEYAAPQLDLQRDKARKELIFALSDAGTSRSSVAAEKLGDLEREYGLQKLSVADQAQGYANQARTDVENARSGLIGLVNSTADASGQAEASLGQARVLAASPSFSPLGQVFQNTTAGIGGIARAQTATPAQGSGVKLYNNAGSGNSGRVVN